MATDDVTGVSGESHDRLRDVQRTRLRELVHSSMSCEFASLSDGKPATAPLTPFYDPERGSVVVSSPLAYAGKIANVERDPRVSLLLHDSDGEYLIRGDATVRDASPSANASYIHGLSDLEPATPKRAANDRKYEFIDTRLGRALMGWAHRRVAIEIEPVSMRRVADAAPMVAPPSWREAGMDRAEAREYERAVLAVVGADGYPETRPITSIRIREGAAHVETEPSTTPVDGQAACLLFHWHDEAGVYLGQRIVRGRFRELDGSFGVVAGSFSTLRNDGALSTLRFMLDGRRRTRANVTPPGPTGWPLLGNTRQFIRDPFAFYESLPAYGTVVRYRIAGTTWTAVLHPDDVERVLVSDSHRFRRYNFEEFGFDVVPDGLFFTDGDQWRRQRRAIQPAFAPAKIAPFGETIVSRAVRTVDGWADGETIAANHAFSELTLEILTATLFDLELAERRAVVTDAAQALADRANTQRLSAILPAWVPTPQNRRFNRAMAEFDALVATLIEERRGEGTPRNDLLSTLLELETDEGDAAFTDDEVRDQLVTFLFAGHETSALTLTYAFLLLEQHGDVRRKLDAELEAVCGDRDPTVEDVPSLKYTETVIKEAMRYYPPVYVLFREALEDVTIDGHLIPEGTKLTLPQFLIHRDERWWDDPLEFRPERWAEEMDDVPEYAYFPFGGGPRHCVGMRFGKLLVTLALATIARRVQFDIESDPDPDLRMAAMLTPERDVRLRVRKR